MVALGRHPYTGWTGRLQTDDHAVVLEAMSTIGVRDLASRDVSTLSDGERQKVMVAKALAQQPSVMILDEITAFLDLPRRVEIMRLLRDLAHQESRTVLLSTHDLDLALKTADEIWLVKEGRLLRGMPEELILDGTFRSVFENEVVQFDDHTGGFRWRTLGCGSAFVYGEGLSAEWTRRALRRIGFETQRSDEGADVVIEVQRDDAGTRWVQYREGIAVVAHDSLRSAVRSLRRRC
jgi:iron complex transport system ATP-binding protein